VVEVGRRGTFEEGWSVEAFWMSALLDVGRIWSGSGEGDAVV
jgi:hypothetical protein